MQRHSQSLCISTAPAAFDRTPSRLHRPCRSSHSLHCTSFAAHVDSCPPDNLKLVRFPRFDSCAPAHVDLSVFPSMSLAPRGSILAATQRDFAFYVAFPKLPLKLAHCPRSLAATLATLPSMSLIPFAPFDLPVCPSMSLTSLQLHSLAGYPRSFTFEGSHPHFVLEQCGGLVLSSALTN